MQLMHGHTVWVEVWVETLAANFSVLCTDETTMPQECTEFVPA